MGTGTEDSNGVDQFYLAKRDSRDLAEGEMSYEENHCWWINIGGYTIYL